MFKSIYGGSFPIPYNLQKFFSSLYRLMLWYDVVYIFRFPRVDPRLLFAQHARDVYFCSFMRHSKPWALIQMLGPSSPPPNIPFNKMNKRYAKSHAQKQPFVIHHICRFMIKTKSAHTQKKKMNSRTTLSMASISFPFVRFISHCFKSSDAI